MKRHKILQNDNYSVWITANKLGTYTHVTFDVEQPNKKGEQELQLNRFQLYLLPSELKELAAFFNAFIKLD